MRAVSKAKGMVVTVLCAGLIIGVVPALGSSNFFPTHLFNESGTMEWGPHHFRLAVTGFVESSERRCRHGRTVKLYFVRHHRRYRRDVGQSSQNGYWGLTGDSHATPRRFVVVATRERVKPGGHHHVVCGAAQTGRKIERSPGPPG
jgi:hypothetical protein